MSELRGCGTQAIELEAADTERILTETATQAVARVVNPDLYVLRPKARG
jgi:hypothetical protein